MDIAITSIGTANPPYKRTQLETAELITTGVQLRPAEKRLLRSVYKATGIEQRYSVLADYCRTPGEFEFFPNDPAGNFPGTARRMKVYKENALALALLAIERCLANLPHLDKQQITHVITISCTGMYAPGLDIEIVQQLNLPSTTKRTVINFMGCYGAFNGMKLAHTICQAEPAAKVLMASVELCTIHFQNKFDMDNIIANAIFADGAAAALIEAKPSNKTCLCFENFHCDLLPQTSQEMTWQVGDHGFDIGLSSYVPQVIQSGIADFTARLLAQYQLTPACIDFYAIHPGGLKILQACEQALNMTVEQNKYAYQVLRHYGNMSSATILFVLQAIWAELTAADQHKRIFSCAFGPGLTLESMLLQIHSV